jgi:hypothetical protein
MAALSNAVSKTFFMDYFSLSIFGFQERVSPLSSLFDSCGRIISPAYFCYTGYPN